jgi:hypothetical protein
MDWKLPPPNRRQATQEEVTINFDEWDGLKEFGCPLGSDQNLVTINFDEWDGLKVNFTTLREGKGAQPVTINFDEWDGLKVDWLRRLRYQALSQSILMNEMDWKILLCYLSKPISLVTINFDEWDGLKVKHRLLSGDAVRVTINFDEWDGLKSTPLDIVNSSNNRAVVHVLTSVLRKMWVSLIIVKDNPAFWPW